MADQRKPAPNQLMSFSPACVASPLSSSAVTIAQDERLRTAFSLVLPGKFHPIPIPFLYSRFSFSSGLYIYWVCCCCFLHLALVYMSVNDMREADFFPIHIKLLPCSLFCSGKGSNFTSIPVPLPSLTLTISGLIILYQEFHRSVDCLR